MSDLAGAVVWGVVPFVPQAPFRVYAGTEREPFNVPSAEHFVTATKKGGDPQFSHLVPAKARPVLIVSDAHDDDLGEYLALRLSRFSKLAEDEQQRVRAQQHPTLFHLRPDKFKALPDESAAMIASLVRLHTSAVVPDVVGRLDADELATVHERLVRFHRLDIRRIVAARVRELQARRGQSSA